MGRRNNNTKTNMEDYESKKSTDSCESTEDKRSKYKRNKGNRGRRNSNNDGVNDKSSAIINNAAWYIKDPNLRSQVSGYSMNSTIGLNTALHYNTQTTDFSHMPFNVRVPSVLAMECNPSPGFTPDPESGRLQFAAINKAARMMYADISSVNAKTTQYQPQDLVFAILSVGEIISMVSHLTRMYGVAFNYSMRNRDIPNSLLLAMKVQPDTLLANLSGFRLRLNSILVSANQITMFSNIPYFQKCWDMYSMIYTDGLSTMSQIYMSVPYSTWIMDETAQGGTKLKTEVLLKADGHLLTADDWLNILEDMVNTLLTSTTYNYIYTDILNYVNKKGGSLYSFGYISEMYRVAPVYNLEYLLQIHNAVPYCIPVNNDVTQNVALNSIQFSPRPVSAGAAMFMDKILDFPHTSDPSEEDKINALVYHCAVTAGTLVETGKFNVGGAAISDHYVVRFNIILGNTTVPSPGYRGNDTASFDVFLDYLTKFDWAPLIYCTDKNENTTAIVGDLNFYDVVPYEVIKQTFEYAYLGLFTLDSSK